MSHANLQNNSEGLFLLGQRVRPAPQPRHRRAPILLSQQFDFVVNTETSATNVTKSTAFSRHGKCIKCNNQISVQPLRPSYQLKINTIGDVFSNVGDGNDGAGDDGGTQVTWGEGSRALGHHLMNIREAETVQQLQGLLRTHKRIQQTTFNSNHISTIHNQNRNNRNNFNNSNSRKISKQDTDLDFINILNSGDIDATLAASIGNVYERCFLVHHTVLQDVIAHAKHSSDT